MYEELKAILINDLSIEENKITPDAHIKNDLGINSLELADLTLSIEENFGIEIDDSKLSKFITVADMVSYLEENAKK